MDRYTYRGEGQYPLAYISHNYFNYECERIKGFAPERLAAYEDTGLTPDEIEILLIANGEKMQQIAALRAELDALKADIEAGLLIRVPCREFFDGAGGTVWLVWGGEAIEMVHCGADIDAEGKPFATLVCEDKIFPYRDGDAEHDTEMSDWCTNVKYVPTDEYEQTVFTTEEAARAALEGGPQ